MDNVIIRTQMFRSHFQPILHEWIDIINRYTNNYTEEDALYWYNERATLSTLAGAIWKTGANNFVLEEFRIDKESRRDGSWQGRADMFFVCGRKQYIVEAKQLWISISNRSHISTDKITAALQIARNEVVASKSDDEIGLGIVFIVPHIPPTEQDQKDFLIKKFIDEILKVDFEMLAYTFPANGNVKSEKGFLHPGVACCIRRPKKD